eukprot:2036675-Amphidinium_carterae.1
MRSREAVITVVEAEQGVPSSCALCHTHDRKQLHPLTSKTRRRRNLQLSRSSMQTMSALRCCMHYQPSANGFLPPYLLCAPKPCPILFGFGDCAFCVHVLANVIDCRDILALKL